MIREDGTACLSDFGLVNLAGGFVEIVEEYIRWFAPEIIRAVTAEQPSGSEVKSMCDKCTDIYSLGTSFSLFMYSKVEDRLKQTLLGMVMYGK